MKNITKIRFGAMAVIANAALALSFSSPAMAMLACPNQTACIPLVSCSNPTVVANACNAIAPAGCSYVSGQCTTTGCGVIPPLVYIQVSCSYS